MTKISNLGVAALALTLSILSTGASAQALQRHSAELDQAIARAKETQIIAKNTPSSTYEGLDVYIGQLIREAESSYIADETELIAALNDAVISTELLLGVNIQEEVAPAATNVRANDVATAEPTYAVAQQTAVESAAEEQAANAQNDEIATTAETTPESTPEAVAELPNTGTTDSKPNYVVITGGSAIVAAVAAAIVAGIVKSKHNA